MKQDYKLQVTIDDEEMKNVGDKFKKNTSRTLLYKNTILIWTSKNLIILFNLPLENQSPNRKI